MLSKGIPSVVWALLLALQLWGSAVHCRRKSRPNLVVILTDDQDIELGSMRAMPKTMRLLGENGAHFENAYASTPLCCPSRSSILTGLYTHNHNVWTNNDNCSSQYWRDTHEVRSFGVHLQSAGYRTGYFGKYLNEYRGTYVPPGWSQWTGLVKNSAYYDYTVNVNGKLVSHGEDYARDYFPDLIVNDSVAFFRHSKQRSPTKPVAMVLSMPSPHGPEDSAPQYQDRFLNDTSHRTMSWNFAPNTGKPWLFQMMGKMEPIQQKFTDLLHAKRLQTLLSVDDAVEKVHQELDRLGELDNTYIMFLSDHGYHLGQFGIAKGKGFPYEFDIKVPFFLKGPEVPQGLRVSNVVGTIDVAPTLLDLAGITVPDYMDGRSIKTLFTDIKNAKTLDGQLVVRKRAWRDTFLLEKGKPGKMKEGTFEVNVESSPYYFKDGKLMNRCAKNRQLYASPCKQGQKWRCSENDNGKLAMKKCRSWLCPCPSDLRLANSSISYDTSQRATQSKFTSERRRKGRERYARDAGKDSSQHPYVFSLKGLINDGLVRECNHTSPGYVCGNEERYKDYDDWNKDKIMELDKVIQKYKDHLQAMKTIRKRYKSKFKTIAQILKTVGNGKQPSATTPALTFPPTTRPPPTTPLISEPQECLCSEDGELVSSRAVSSEKWTSHSSAGQGRSYRQRAASLLPASDFTPASFGFEDEPLPERKPRDRKLERRRNGRRKDKKGQRRDPNKVSRRRDPTCRAPGLACLVMNDDHWTVEPLWTMGPFCLCINAPNNTYFCLRTINATHNYLYCEYTTGFISYYDLLEDPYQLRNAVYDLDYGVLYQLHKSLARLKSCSGSKECTVRYRNKDNN